jgi:SAM-dependent methyltransferase
MSKNNYYNEIIARNYDKVTTSGYYDYEKLVKEFKKIVKGRLLLELGIGTGCLAEVLIKNGYIVEGIEPSEAMIQQLKKKNLPIKVYKQDGVQLNTGKKYDALYSSGAIPMTLLREKGIFFDTYIIDKEEFHETMKKSYEHLKENGFFMTGAQAGETDNVSIGNFYRNESKYDGDIIIKTHFFKEGNKWLPQTLRARMWPEKDFIGMMEKIGFKTIGLNGSKTWYVFKK